MIAGLQLQETLPKKRVKEQGVVGTEIYWGFLKNQEFNTEWQDSNRTEKFKTIYKMLNTDGMISAVTTAIHLMLLQGTIDIEPGTQDNIDLQIAEEVKQELFQNPNFSWTDLYSHVLLYRHYGFYLFEKSIYYDSKDGKNHIYNIAPRLPSTIQRWNRENRKLKSIEQFAQTDKGGYETININNENLVLFTHNREGDNYVGISDLRPVYRNYKAKDMLIRLSLINYDRNAVKIPIIHLPEDEQDGDLEKAQTFGETYRSHEKGYGIIPYGWDMTFADEKSNLSVQIKNDLKFHNTEIANRYLSGFMSMGDAGGSYAMHKDKTDLFYVALQEQAHYIENIFNERNERRAIIKDYVDWNYNRVEKYPKLKHTKIAAVDFEKLSQTLLNLANGGFITPSPEIEDKLRQDLELPESTTIPQPKETKPNIKNKQIDKEKQKEISKEEDLCECEHHLIENDKEFIFNRDMTDIEKRVLNLKEISTKLEDFKDDLIKIGNQSRKHMINKLIDRAKILLAKKITMQEFSKQANEFVSNVISKGKWLNQSIMTNDLTRKLKEIFKFGQNQIKAELNRQGLKIKMQAPEDLILEEGAKMVRPLAELAVSSLANKLTENWKKEISRQKALGIFNLERLMEILVNLSKNDFKREMTEATMQTFGHGRTNQAMKYSDQIEKVIRSEIMDRNTCKNCEKIDGEEFDINDPFFQRMAGGPFLECEGNFMCRGINIYSVKE